MPISSSTLFHFTGKLEYLSGILKGAFFPRYSLESIESINRETGKKKNFNKGVPMVCFCDIPLSQVKSHIEFYGNYGIGLKKSWGRRMGLNPLFYLDKSSIVSDHIVDLSYEIFKPEYKDKPEYKALKAKYHDIVRYTKPYSGQNVDRRTGDTIDEYIFYNEREWRFVPKINDWEDKSIYLTEAQFGDIEYRKGRNKAMESRAIRFSPSDVAYIIVQHEYEIQTMMDTLEKEGFPFQETKILISKIQTSYQILHDF